ncbi:putative ELYS-like domain-containing protein [Helianthus annuus]|uniref:ELYS-like domain-containing protein n=1 Tax=Helianthus annuus TaxID=4232 RepID=A0A251SCJ6_HELAN|nr:putative ELYS-like domain-containing protein [Helianthus annuus]KAJ0453036.1 putative E3 ubiquitin-protein ligase HOS1 [Helianthus annuus]KAJ0474953.1 putative E3 ubiquitin-protein ligase HOS1 [Helianthus annuus]KAJ0650508.1 putative E3 ubiquitin-protein ligase HOS1 [Helianthus annuus]KAJ0654260.1 putative E3 ubiquitin-protein ligase HOS1 [Helianthus annuus]
MDESAVSSDPVVALLLDEVVVKDWCKWTFKNIIAELKPIYNLNVEEVKERSNVLLKFTARLACILYVLEVLESSFKGSLSAQLQDIHHLQENILKTKQHMEMLIWYTRHQHLEYLNRHASFPSWRSDVRERKSTAIKHAWPAPTEISTPDGEILFIHDALSNLDPQQEYTPDRDYELEIASLQKDEDFSLSRAKIEGLIGSYPFKNLRSTIDVLFLYGSSDLVVAKQAIFLYYLFDRLWKDTGWAICIQNAIVYLWHKWKSKLLKKDNLLMCLFLVQRLLVIDIIIVEQAGLPGCRGMLDLCRIAIKIDNKESHIQDSFNCVIKAATAFEFAQKLHAFLFNCARSTTTCSNSVAYFHADEEYSKFGFDSFD